MSSPVYHVEDWSLYRETTKINGITVTYVDHPLFRGNFRVVKRNVAIVRFLDDIKPHFHIEPCGYIVVQRDKSQHILFHYEETDELIEKRKEYYPANIIEQVRRCYLFRELFAITSKDKVCLMRRGESVISVNEFNSLVFTREAQHFIILEEKITDFWFRPLEIKDIISYVFGHNSVLSFISMLQNNVSRCAENENTAILVNYAVRRLTELAL